MTNTQHTPRPWEAQWSTRTNGGPKQGWHVFNRETVDVDGIVCDVPDGPDAERHAHILAEAPAMLAFTGRALAWLTGEIGGLVDEEIESAIAQERQPTDEAIRERLASEARAILAKFGGAE